MKKLVALLLAVIAVVSLCSCSNSTDSDYSYNEPSNQNQQLNAKTFSLLMDSNAFLYAIWMGRPCAFYFYEPSGLSFKTAPLNESFDIDYSHISTEFYWNISVYDDSHFSISDAPIITSKYTYSLFHSDSKGKYVVFVDDEYESKDEDNKSSHMLIFMSSELLKLVFNKLHEDAKASGSGDSLREVWPSNAEKWIEVIDSCK